MNRAVRKILNFAYCHCFCHIRAKSPVVHCEGKRSTWGELLTTPIPICATFEIPREISEPVTSGTGSPCYKEMAMVQKSSFQSCLNVCGDFPKSRY